MFLLNIYNIKNIVIFLYVLVFFIYYVWYLLYEDEFIVMVLYFFDLSSSIVIVMNLKCVNILKLIFYKCKLECK